MAELQFFYDCRYHDCQINLKIDWVTFCIKLMIFFGLNMSGKKYCIHSKKWPDELSQFIILTLLKMMSISAKTECSWSSFVTDPVDKINEACTDPECLLRMNNKQNNLITFFCNWQTSLVVMSVKYRPIFYLS